MFWAVVLNEKVTEELSDTMVYLQVRCLNGGIRLLRVAFGHFRGEQLWVPDKPHHIVIAGDYPHPILGIPVDGILLPQSIKIGVGISDDFWSEQIVIDSRYHNTSRSVKTIVPGLASPQSVHRLSNVLSCGGATRPQGCSVRTIYVTAQYGPRLSLTHCP